MPNLSDLFGGLSIAQSRHSGAARTAVTAACGVIILIAASDLVFRHSLSPKYVAIFADPNLAPHIIAFVVLATGEEIVFRLVIMSLLVALGWALLKRSKPEWMPWAALLAATFAQMLNVARFPLPHGAAEVVYTGFRYLVPGIVWGWLYWRYSFLTALGAHAGTHLILDPLLFVLLRE